MDLSTPNGTERPEKTNKDFVAAFATKLLFGNNPMLKDAKKNTGLSSGLKKLILSGNSANSQVTASLNLNRLKIIGSDNCPMNSLIILNTNI